MPELEICCDCGDPTGRAGVDEDSLYADGLGPFCPDCWDDLPHAMATEIRHLKDKLLAQHKEG